ncbi:unnamed protein product, partial [Ectocarpus sp. 8 AP-2014]
MLLLAARHTHRNIDERVLYLWCSSCGRAPRHNTKDTPQAVVNRTALAIEPSPDALLSLGASPPPFGARPVASPFAYLSRLNPSPFVSHMSFTRSAISMSPAPAVVAFLFLAALVPSRTAPRRTNIPPARDAAAISNGTAVCSAYGRHRPFPRHRCCRRQRRRSSIGPAAAAAAPPHRGVPQYLPPSLGVGRGLRHSPRRRRRRHNGGGRRLDAHPGGSGGADGRPRPYPRRRRPPLRVEPRSGRVGAVAYRREEARHRLRPHLP